MSTPFKEAWGQDVLPCPGAVPGGGGLGGQARPSFGDPQTSLRGGKNIVRMLANTPRFST